MTKPLGDEKPEDFNGVITAVAEDGTFSVKFDSGDEGDGYLEDELIEVLTSVPETEESFDNKETPVPTKPVKTPEDLEREYEQKRKEEVDVANKAHQVFEKEKEAKLANKPLTLDEREFCVDMADRLKKGQFPNTDHMVKYSKLRKRL